MAPVRAFFVDNLHGASALDATVAVASSEQGGVYPPGSVVQLVATEVMVMREPGFSPDAADWKFFELDVAAEGAQICARGGLPADAAVAIEVATRSGARLVAYGYQ